MSSRYEPINYATTSFHYPVLTRIHGPPNYKTLANLKKELQSHAQSVGSDLGGGAHGHLGLVLTPTEYQSVSNVPYVSPQFPGPLTLPRNADVAEAVRRSNAHDERVQVLKEVHDIKNALVRLFVAAAVDKQYIAELRDKSTNNISYTIPEILAYLFENFADMDVEDVEKEVETLNQMYWNINHPPMVLKAPT